MTRIPNGPPVKPLPTTARRLIFDLLWSGVVALVVFGAIQWWQDRGQPRTGAMLDTQAPVFALPDVHTGETVGLSEFRGKPVVLNFWATWCAPCRREIPALNRLSRTAGNQLHVVTVTADEPQTTRTFLRRHDYSVTCLLDGDAEVSQRYGVKTLPRTLVIDADGRVTQDIVGELDIDALRDALGPLLP